MPDLSRFLELILKIRLTWIGVDFRAWVDTGAVKNSSFQYEEYNIVK